MIESTALTGYQWPDLAESPEALAAPVFPTDSLPTWLAHFVRAQSTASQVPEDMTGMLALSALSAAVQGRINAIANNGTWTEPICLYTAVVMAPGERKSSVFEQVTRPLVDWEYEVQEAEWPMVAASQQEMAEIEKAVESADLAVQKTAAAVRKARRDETLAPDTIRGLEADLKAAQEDATEARIAQGQYAPRYKFRLVANDLTPEVASTMLSRQQSHHLAIISDEGGVFEVLTGSRYADRLNLDVFLKSHSGNLIQVDRINRDPERINRPMMSLGLAVQPEVLRDIGKSKQMHGRGLLARFLWCVPTTFRGSRQIDSPQVPEQIRDQYDTGMREIAIAAHGQAEIHSIFLDDEASSIFMGYQQQLEPRLREEGELDQIIEWASKLAGAVLRIAVLMACARERGIPQEVTYDDIIAAIEFGDYLEAHAFRAFSLMGIIPSSQERIKITRAIREHSWSTFTLRDLQRGTNSARRMNQDQLEELLADMESDGFVKRQIVSTKPFKVQWAVNPALLGENVA